MKLGGAEPAAGVPRGMGRSQAGEIHSYRVDRIKDARVTDRPFSRRFVVDFQAPSLPEQLCLLGRLLLDPLGTLVGRQDEERQVGAGDAPRGARRS